MAYNYEYPYTSANANADWILKRIKELTNEFDTFKIINSIKFKGEWTITENYPIWSLVDNNGNGYISIKNVPAGIELNNEDYWRLVANYSAIYADFQNRVIELENHSGEVDSEIEVINNNVGLLTSHNSKEIYGAIRPTISGWTIINNSEHTPKNIQSVEIDSSGRLVIHHSCEAEKVGALVVCPDESFSKYGIACGASVGLDSSIISLSINAHAGGYVSGTGKNVTWSEGFNQFVKSITYDEAHAYFKIELNDTLKALSNIMSVNITNGRMDSWTHKATIGDGFVGVYCLANGETTSASDPSGTINFSIDILLNPIVDPQRLVDNAEALSSFNLWIFGQME